MGGGEGLGEWEGEEDPPSPKRRWKTLMSNLPLSQSHKGQSWTQSPLNPAEGSSAQWTHPWHLSLTSASLQTRWIQQPQDRKPCTGLLPSSTCPAAFPLPIWGLGQSTKCSRRRKQLGRGAPSFSASGCPASTISIITICSSSTRMKTCARGGCVNTLQPAKQQSGFVISYTVLLELSWGTPRKPQAPGKDIRLKAAVGT